MATAFQFHWAQVSETPLSRNLCHTLNRYVEAHKVNFGDMPPSADPTVLRITDLLEEYGLITYNNEPDPAPTRRPA